MVRPSSSAAHAALLLLALAVVRPAAGEAEPPVEANPESPAPTQAQTPAPTLTPTATPTPEPTPAPTTAPTTTAPTPAPTPAPTAQPTAPPTGKAPQAACSRQVAKSQIGVGHVLFCFVCTTTIDTETLHFDRAGSGRGMRGCERRRCEKERVHA